MYGVTPNIQRIPASSDKHVHNITQFRGIVDTDNPLIAPDGSAREMENLYIDKDGVLAVRPRLDYNGILSDHEKNPLNGEVIKILHSKHGDYSIIKNGDVYYIYFNGKKIYFKDTDKHETKTYIDAMLNSHERLYVFLDDDILCSNGSLTNPELSSIYNSSYVKTPTVSKGSILGDNINPDIDNNYEDFNVLTTEYRRTYFYNPLTTNWKKINYKKDIIHLENSYTTDVQKNINVPVNFNIEQILYKTDSYELIKTKNNEVFSIKQDCTFLKIGDYDPTNVYILIGDYLDIYKIKSSDDVSKWTIELLKRYNLLGQTLIEIEVEEKKSYEIPQLKDYEISSLSGSIGININNITYIAVMWSISDTFTYTILYKLTDKIEILFEESNIWGKNTLPDQTVLHFSHDKKSNNIIMLYPYTTSSGGFIEIATIDLTNGLLLYNFSKAYVLQNDKFISSYDNKIAFKSDNNWILLDYTKSYEIEKISSDVKYLDINFYDDAKFEIYKKNITTTLTSHDQIYINNALVKDYIKPEGWNERLYIVFKQQENIILIDYVSKYKYEIIYDPYIKPELDQAYGYFTDTSKFIKTSGKLRQFDNKWWMFKGNEVRYTSDLSFDYLPYNNKQTVGGPEPITDILQITDTSALLFKEKETYMVTKIEGTEFYNFTSLKTSMGHIPTQQSIMSYTNMPIIINDKGVYTISQLTNVYDSDKIFTSLSDDVAKIYKSFGEKNRIKTHNHEFYTYIYYPEEKITKILVLDSRNLCWYYWELPIKISYIEEINNWTESYGEDITSIKSGNLTYNLVDKSYAEKNQEEHSAKEDIFTYQDRMGPGRFKRIKWKWKSHPMTLNIINNLKKLTRFGLMFADRERELTYVYSDNKYELGTPGELSNLELFYTIKTYRKKSQIFNDSYGDKIEYVASVRLKPRVNKFDYIELELSNYKEDVDGYAYYTYSDVPVDNNQGFGVFDKLNLIGLTFETVLSTGV